MVLIVVAGIGLIVYSRNELLYPVTVGPTATDNWQVAFAVDLCGTVQGDLPANSNLTSVGIRTFGNGLIDVDPGAVSTNAAAFEGKNATLGKFASSYPGFTLTSTSIRLPGKSSRTWKDGDACTTAAGPLHGAGKLEVETWSSPSARGVLVTGDPTSVHLDNGEMITVAFVPAGAVVPEPPSKSALLQALGSASTSGTAKSSSTPSKAPSTGASGKSVLPSVSGASRATSAHAAAKKG